eukprot:m.1297558 g.1297558  ORF g.1297558 m.1297558 type:complete len:178 (-) comp24798_c1_seq21:2103-2636(-)
MLSPSHSASASHNPHCFCHFRGTGGGFGRHHHGFMDPFEMFDQIFNNMGHGSFGGFGGFGSPFFSQTNMGGHGMSMQGMMSPFGGDFFGDQFFGGGMLPGFASMSQHRSGGGHGGRVFSSSRSSQTMISNGRRVTKETITENGVTTERVTEADARTGEVLSLTVNGERQPVAGMLRN